MGKLVSAHKATAALNSAYEPAYSLIFEGANNILNAFNSTYVAVESLKAR